ncbi:MFS family permease [Microbacterium sp. AK009]|uniref:MFS transporter n=1 Tax=Microbacterium sp. AK009 TaxID=2723068 RepID=UPI0015CB737E|nr:MFS transporter [Microbacterium sp. AK009]NYF16900.1 MFS family permease [Microbacterium sp. AK009]
MTTAPRPAPSPSRSTLRFLPVGVALLCVQLDFFSLGLALPSIASAFGSSVTDLQWVLSAYMLSLGAFSVPAGRVGDVIGRRAAVVVGLGLFAGASVLCALSGGVGAIVAGRLIQGVGAALILPNAFALITNDTDDAERPRALGWMIGVSGLGTALGPIVGGLLASTIGWPWVFWLNIPLAAVAALGTARVRDSRNPEAGSSLRTIDWAGVATVILGLGLLSVGIDNVPELGWFAPLSSGLIVAGVVGLVLWVLVERRATYPLIHASLLRNRAYLALLSVGTIGNMGTNVLIVTATFTLQSVRGFDPQVSGLYFLAGSTGVAIAGPIVGKLCQRWSAIRVLGATTALTAVGLSAMLVDALPLYCVAMFAAGLAGGMTFSAAQIGVQTVVPPRMSGEATSFMLMPVVALGGLGVVIVSGVIEAIGRGEPTPTGIDAVLVGYSAVLLVTGVTLLVAEHAGLFRPKGVASPSRP